tara:strand:- start:123 stop:359 length:237 start_codon:yes stop_codon:yes gene_type:complete
MEKITQQDIYKVKRDIKFLTLTFKDFQKALVLLSENQEQLLKEVKDNRECLEKTTNFSLDISKELLKASKILKDMNNA